MTTSTCIAEAVGNLAPDTHFFGKTTSRLMATVERTIMDVAATDLPIFITGESGTGKGTLASVLHLLSRRREQDFVKINCGIGSSGLRAEWRSAAHPFGLTESQARGTVLLDEVTELDLQTQSSIVEMLSDTEPLNCAPERVRIVSASRRNIEEAIRNGHLLEVLYYRLKGVVLRLPSLRERKEDIPILADFFVSKYSSKFQRAVDLSGRAIDAFMAYDWPGNVRELENTVVAILALGNENPIIDTFRFGERPALAGNGSAKTKAHQHSNRQKSGMSLKQVSKSASERAERELIRKVLERTQWNRKRAAEELQISYKALLYKLKRIESENGAVSDQTEK